MRYDILLDREKHKVDITFWIEIITNSFQRGNSSTHAKKCGSNKKIISKIVQTRKP